MSLKRAVKTVFAGFLGVQSRAQYEQDLQEHRFVAVAIVGVLMTAGFVLMVYGLISAVMALVR
ncbi:MAG: DUF2970 domain-containing protein [Litorivicinaceae bacterium]|nr:DUF2970 domain-containing protein [Litorivicinaceae bacterium]MDP5329171.1 DUF2970 domain-containing protein [Litorivicinaceae bacterium]MDP5330058.1 DUF2970 domain-containing protein [Litorivicinaceae bacterium]MDP5342465.1 DUF2970 domain-containing protein [Litorivicinaceae bacterium]MDP5343903.1 DUF2970 domain-containing protein [Litorivicinaceae bacterium]